MATGSSYRKRLGTLRSADLPSRATVLGVTIAYLVGVSGTALITAVLAGILPAVLARTDRR